MKMSFSQMNTFTINTSTINVHRVHQLLSISLGFTKPTDGTKYYNTAGHFAVLVTGSPTPKIYV